MILFTSCAIFLFSINFTINLPMKSKTCLILFLPCWIPIWNNPPWTVHYHFKGYQDENLKKSANSMESLFRLHMCQRLVTFVACRILVRILASLILRSLRGKTSHVRVILLSQYFHYFPLLILYTIFGCKLFYLHS